VFHIIFFFQYNFNILFFNPKNFFNKYIYSEVDKSAIEVQYTNFWNKFTITCNISSRAAVIGKYDEKEKEMMKEILNITFSVLIAIPFIYMIFDVSLDVMKRIYGFYRAQTKPVLISTKTRFKR
jgi:hypothetical protein